MTFCSFNLIILKLIRENTVKDMADLSTSKVKSPNIHIPQTDDNLRVCALVFNEFLIFRKNMANWVYFQNYSA